MATIVDSYSEANRNSYQGINRVHPTASPSVASAVTQSFTGDGQKIDSCKWHLQRVNNPGNLIARLYAHSGTFGTNSVPTGAALDSSSTVAASGIGTGAFELVTFSGFAGYTLVNGTKYCIVIECYDGTWDDTNHVFVGADTTSPTHGGNWGWYEFSAWGTAAFDNCFYVYGVAAGWANIGKVLGATATDYGKVNGAAVGDLGKFNGAAV